jgi:hypothetical protein
MCAAHPGSFSIISKATRPRPISSSWANCSKPSSSTSNRRIHAVQCSRGGYGGPEVDAALRPHDIVQIQTAFRGLAPDPDRVTLADFEPTPATADPLRAARLTCPHGQTADLEPGRNPDRFIARFECPPDCPLLARCPTRTWQTDARRSLRLDQADLDLAQRRRSARAARAPNRAIRVPPSNRPSPRSNGPSLMINSRCAGASAWGR